MDSATEETMRINIRNPVWSVVIGAGLLAFAQRESRWRKQAAATGTGLIARGIAVAIAHEFGRPNGARPARAVRS